MEIVLRAAESDPGRRYADTAEMLSDLALLKAGKSLRYLRRVETRLKRAGQVLMVSALWLSIAGGAWYYERHRRGQVEAAEKQLQVDLGPASTAIRHVTIGFPIEEIMKYAGEHDIDLIVVGTHGHTGLSHLLLGSVAEKLVRLATCPVLTVHPKGHQFVA